MIEGMYFMPDLRSALPIGLLIALLTGPVASTSLAVAAPSRPSSGTKESFYRCKDENGQTRYSDSVPPECRGVDIEVLDQRGTVLRVIEGTKSAAARVQREAKEGQEQAVRQASAQHDRMLLDTYLTVDDLERLRDQRMDLLEAQLRVTEQNIASLKDRQRRLQDQIKRFRPYAENPEAPPLPDHIAEDLVNTVNSRSAYEQTITRKRAEQAALKQSFQTDINRFKELKGIP